MAVAQPVRAPVRRQLRMACGEGSHPGVDGFGADGLEQRPAGDVDEHEVPCEVGDVQVDAGVDEFPHVGGVEGLKAVADVHPPVERRLRAGAVGMVLAGDDLDPRGPALAGVDVGVAKRQGLAEPHAYGTHSVDWLRSTSLAPAAAATLIDRPERAASRIATARAYAPRWSFNGEPG